MATANVIPFCKFSNITGFYNESRGNKQRSRHNRPDGKRRLHESKRVLFEEDMSYAQLAQLCN